MLRRIAYGSLLVAAILMLTTFDAILADYGASWRIVGPLIRHGSVIPLVLTAISLIASLELTQLSRAAGFRPHVRWAAAMAVFLTLAPWLSSAGWFGDGPSDVEGVKWQLIGMAAALIGLALLQIRRPVADGAIGDFATTCCIISYAGLLPSFITLLRCDVSLPGPVGAWLVLVFVLVTKASDIGAYFGGSLLGRHKLAPAISPGKTVEGAIGGVAGSVLLMLLIVAMSSLVGRSSIAGIESVTRLGKFGTLIGQLGGSLPMRHVSQSIMFAVVMSVGGQIGDLIESAFKRSARAKDSAHLVPGFGGVLDMVDSIYLTAPIAWFMLTPD